jgi:hypothetical protein
MVDSVNLSMIYLIYCKNFCKCHNAPPPSTTITTKENWGNGDMAQVVKSLSSNSSTTKTEKETNIKNKNKQKLGSTSFIAIFWYWGGFY